MTFHPDFTWGAATAAYQIEGGYSLNGKGPSIWDQFSHGPGNIYQGHTGDVASDHIHRLEEDLDLMAQIGLQAYRFSFSWPRIQPEGTGPINQAGIDFYDRLIDGLLQRGIQPWGTLFHWCYPLALYQRGGWMNPESPEWFAAYTEIIAKNFGDRITHWMTLNEPQIFIGHGHVNGTHAPGLQLSDPEIARIIHHVLCAHGRSVQVLRSTCPQEMQIGWASAVGVSGVDPATEEDPEVIERARKHQFEFREGNGAAFGQSIWCDPVFHKRYPDAFLALFEQELPSSWAEDLEGISAPVDFCGLNVYAETGHMTRNAEGEVKWRSEMDYGEGFPRTLFGWPVTPDALYWGPRFFHERYGAPIVITENGMSGHDWVSLDGAVHDPYRTDFAHRYLSALHKASADGIPVTGYFHWSLMDNFEWANGYKERFGLIHVDFDTGKRTLKDSAKWYREVIDSNGDGLIAH